MKLSEKHFVDPQLMAIDPIEVNVPRGLLQSLGAITEEARAVTGSGDQIQMGDNLNFFVLQLPDWNSDLRWIPQADEHSFEFFEGLFRLSGAAGHVERYVDFAETIRLYSGFFVTRSYCTAPHFHVDWIDGQNDAFQFISPLSNNCGQLGLVYRDRLGRSQKYTYRLSKALIIGDHFLHSVQPGETKEPVVLLSFSFGTDKMARWPQISQTAANQGIFHRRPDGVFVRSCKNLAKRPDAT